MSDVDWDALSSGLPHWNGERWVSAREWEAAKKILALRDYYALPWYKRLFTRRPQ